MKDLIRMNQLAGVITEGQARKMIQILNEDETTMISPSIVSKYVRMKSLFGDKAGDMELITKIKPIVTTFFPKNLDVSFKKLVDEYGKEVASGAITVLFGAYLDGRLDSFKDSITRLSNEKQAYYDKK
jgi:hypothetical protein